MPYYFFKSPYRWAIAGLTIGLISLWYWWFRTEQIVSSSLIALSTGTTLLNIVLAFFAYDRHAYLTRFLFIFSYLLLALVAYTMFTLSRGVI